MEGEKRRVEAEKSQVLALFCLPVFVPFSLKVEQNAKNISLYNIDCYDVYLK